MIMSFNLRPLTPAESRWSRESRGFFHQLSPPNLYHEVMYGALVCVFPLVPASSQELQDRYVCVCVSVHACVRMYVYDCKREVTC